jgi:hypothetical protein
MLFSARQGGRMRRYIRDDKLHAVLTALEDWYGYAFGAAELTGQMRKTHRAAMDRKEGKWIFLHNPDDPPSHVSLCHEMMHIVLFIEGWPAWEVFPLSIKDSIDNMFFDFLLNFAQHILISQRVEVLGYTEADRIEKDMDKFALSNREKQTVHLHHHLPWLRIQALIVSELLLAQSDLHAKKRFRNFLQQYRSQMLLLADAICDAVAKRQPLDWQSSEYLVYDILEMLEMPKGILRPLRSDNICHDFFRAHIRSLGGLEYT